MNRKILTSANGNLLQLTLTPWEMLVLKSLAGKANIPSIVTSIGNGTNQAVGKVIREFYLILE